MIWLGIDTANRPLSVAIVKDEQVLVEESTSIAVNHSLGAMPAIEKLFQRIDMKPSEIDAIAVSEGPGSYTGVRIGVTIAKTLAWTLNKKLVGVSSLKAMAANIGFFNGLICPMIDARRNHVYAGAYCMENGELKPIVADGHYSIEDLMKLLNEEEQQILFIGQDVALHELALKDHFGESAVVAPYHFNLPRASSLISVAQQMTDEVEIHHFVPEYRRIAEAEANWLKAQRQGLDNE